MGYSMIIYAQIFKGDNDIYLKELVSWKNHYLLNMWFNEYAGFDTEGVLIPFEDAIYDLEEDCKNAIKFLKDHVTGYRLHISEDESLIGEWEYKWDKEIPENPFFKHDFRFYLGRYGVEGFIDYLELILEFISNYDGKYSMFVYQLV